MAVEDPQALIFAGLAIFAVIYVIKWQTDPLRSIPTVGGPSAPGLSFVAAYNWLHNSKNLMFEAYQKYHGSAFKVALFDRWLVIVSGPKLIEQLVRLPDNELSAMEGNLTVVRLRRFATADSLDDPFHVDVIREKLTRRLAVIFPDLVDEVKLALSGSLPTKGEEWVALNVLTKMREVIVRASSRVFVGLPLCRNEEYLKLALCFTSDMLQSRTQIAALPSFLQPLFVSFWSKPHRTIRRAMEFIKPFIDERKAKLEELGEDWLDKSSQNNMLQWIIEEGISRKTTDYSIVERIFLINFAAIETSSATATRVLSDLAAMPERIPELREEIESAIATDGWTKTALGEMLKLDSAVKESMRTHTSLIGLSRKAMVDITLSDGTFIPKGTLVAAAAAPVHHDESVYANPDVLEPFRFAKMRGDDGEGLKHQLVNTSYDFLPFGHGKHACPGRFFAANELKVVLAFIILNYDMKLGGDGKRSKDSYHGSTVLLPTEPVFFRKRQMVFEA